MKKNLEKVNGILEVFGEKSVGGRGILGESKRDGKKCTWSKRGWKKYILGEQERWKKKGNLESKCDGRNERTAEWKCKQPSDQHGGVS